MKLFQLISCSIILSLLACKSQDGNQSSKHHLYTNALAAESSPYLLQHAHNPVNWYPWKETALEKAQAEDKLLLISIGYAACHWCHVMEHESFEDTMVARVMNENFVNIKVDREERPDVDDVYMTACQLASGGGCGWPLNAIALPDGRPVWAGTYFPKKKWVEILDYFVKAGKNERQELEGYAEKLLGGIQSLESLAFNTEEAIFTSEQLSTFSQQIIDNTDFNRGGKQGAPKFPLPNIWQFLLRYHHLTRDKSAFEAVEKTIDHIANGGIYDHLGGGFARYSTDANWIVPHFEKMMYDNGQLVSLYAQAFQLTKNPLYQQKVEETLAWVAREMTSKEGGFYSSLDADSEGEEGKFYVWTAHEIDSLLAGNTAAINLFKDYYEIRKSGNWEHEKNILYRRKAIDDLLKKHQITAKELAKSIQESQTKLIAAREQRIRPGLDDKILTSWNALMLRGYVDAYKAFAKPEYLNTALNNANFLSQNALQPDGRLNRNYKDGKSVINAFLDDYALTISAFTALYEVTFDEQWLTKSKLMADYVLNHFSDESTGMFFYTSDLDKALITRKMELTDNVIPSSNSAMARALFYLGTYLYEDSYLAKSQQMLSNMLPKIQESQQANFYSNWLQLYLEILHPPYEVAIIGDDYLNKQQEMMQHYLPNAILLGGKTEGNLALLKDKLQQGETMIYVCQNKVCKFPVQEVEQALGLLE